MFFIFEKSNAAQHGSFDLPANSTFLLILSQTLSILMEFCPGGSISKALSVFGAFPEPIIQSYARQILQGLKFLHENRIIHR